MKSETAEAAATTTTRARKRDPVVKTRAEKKVSTRTEDQVKDPGIYFIESPGAGGVISSTRLDPAMKARVQEIVQCGKFPFNSENKLIRTAVHYFVEKVIGAKMHATFRDDLKLAAMQQQILKATARLADVRKFVLSTAHALNTLAGADQRDEAVAVWHRVNIMMCQMEEPYRSMYREAFKSDKCVEWKTVRTGLGLRVMEPREVKKMIGGAEGAEGAEAQE